MRCPYCSAQDTKVIDSRLASDGDQVRRRRECGECGERFTTFEVVELNLPRIVKRDKTIESFDKHKLRNGLIKALEKRPVSTVEIDKAIGRIERRLVGEGLPEVSSDFLGECVMKELRELDQVAYVRFASVYRSFQDVNEFHDEISRLLERQKLKP